MQTIRLLAQIFHYMTKTLAIVYVVSATYTFVVLVLKKIAPSATYWPIRIYEWESPHSLGLRFDILIPFTDAPLFLGRYTSWGILEIILGMGLYGLFFYLISRVFQAFRQDKLFTSASVTALMRFAKANFIFPPLFLFFLYLHPDYPVEEGEMLFVFLHVLLGVFALFQAVVFREGLTLQEEQDLTI